MTALKAHKQSPFTLSVLCYYEQLPVSSTLQLRAHSLSHVHTLSHTCTDISNLSTWVPIDSFFLPSPFIATSRRLLHGTPAVGGFQVMKPLMISRSHLSSTLT